MTDTRHSGDKGKRGEQSATQPEEESHVHKGLFGGLKDFGNSALHKTKEIAGDVSDGVKKNAPKVLHAAKEVADSPTGRKIQNAGKEIVNDEIQHGKNVGAAAQRGDVKALGKEVLPLALGVTPQGLIIKEVGGKVLEKAVQNVPQEHRGHAQDAKQVLAARDLIGHGFPSAQNLIIDAATDSKKQHQVVGLGKQAADGVSNLWHKATGSHSEDNRSDKERAEDMAAERAKAAKHPHTGKQ